MPERVPSQPAVAPGLGLVIRPYQPADLDAVIAVFKRAVREIASRDYDQAQVDAWAGSDPPSEADRDHWRLRRASRPTWVAVIDEKTCGFADLEPTGHLDMMFVHPDYQRRGVASSLLGCVESAARSQGIARIFTNASITAKPFFLKHGFTVEARQVVEVRRQKLANFRMEKLLR